MHFDIVLRRAVGVITAVDGHTAKVDMTVIRYLLAVADVDYNLTIDLGCVVCMAFAKGDLITQTTAIDVAVQRAVQEVNLGHVGSGIVHVTKCRATIEVTIDGRNNRASSIADGDRHIATCVRIGTEAATEDVDTLLSHVARISGRTDCCSTYIGQDIHGDIAGHEAVDVGTAIETGKVSVGRVIVDDDTTIRGGRHIAVTLFACDIALTAAVDAAVEGVAADGERSGVGRRSVDATQCRAAVEVAIDGCAVECDTDVAGRGSGCTETAAIDVCLVA